MTLDLIGWRRVKRNFEEFGKILLVGFQDTWDGVPMKMPIPTFALLFLLITVLCCDVCQ